MRLLITDKSKIIIKRLEELLSESTFILMIDKAFSYEEAQRLFKQNEPDIVVMDINLPGNRSYQLLKEIKATSPQTVVIVLSFRIDEHILQQCKNLGADVFLDKYYEFEHIPVIMNEITIKKMIA